MKKHKGNLKSKDINANHRVFIINKNSGSGITLIALIVTIIVLIILSGVTIALLRSDNGILYQAIEAKKHTELASEKERIEMAVLSAISKSDNNELTTEKLEEELQNEFKNTYGSLNIGEDSWDYFGENEKFHIDNNGNVSIGTHILNYKIYGNDDFILPAEYQQVEYIESTGTQYIDTESNATDITAFELWMIPTKASSAYQSYLSSVLDDFTIGMYNYIDNTYLRYRTQEITVVGKLSTTEINKIQLLDNAYTINTTTYKTMTINAGLGVNKSNIFLFNNSRFSRGASMKLYLLKLYNNGSTYRTFIPCYEKRTNEIGLYDTVESKFYTNQGNGDNFFKGTDVCHNVGNKNDSNKYDIPLKILTPNGDIFTSITLNFPLRKADDKVDYIDLKNKKVVRYDSDIAESIEINDLPAIKDIIKIDVLTDIQPSKIEICEIE